MSERDYHMTDITQGFELRVLRARYRPRHFKPEHKRNRTQEEARRRRQRHGDQR